MAAALTCAAVAGPVGPDRVMITGPLGPPPPHGTATFTLKDGKSQSTSSACPTAKVSGFVRDSPTGTFIPLLLSWLGAATAQTALAMLQPMATSGMMIARPGGIRAKSHERRDLP